MGCSTSPQSRSIVTPTLCNGGSRPPVCSAGMLSVACSSSCAQEHNMLAPHSHHTLSTLPRCCRYCCCCTAAVLHCCSGPHSETCARYHTRQGDTHTTSSLPVSPSSERVMHEKSHCEYGHASLVHSRRRSTYVVRTYSSTVVCALTTRMCVHCCTAAVVCSSGIIEIRVTFTTRRAE